MLSCLRKERKERKKTGHKKERKEMREASVEEEALVKTVLNYDSLNVV